MDIYTYKEYLRRSLENVTFDTIPGKVFQFEKLFYPLVIADGQISFLSYAELLNYAKTRVREDYEDKESVYEADETYDQAQADFERSIRELMELALDESKKEKNAYQNLTMDRSHFRSILSENADDLSTDENEKEDSSAEKQYSVFGPEEWKLVTSDSTPVLKEMGADPLLTEDVGKHAERSNEKGLTLRESKEIERIFPEKGEKYLTSLIVPGKRVIAIANAGHGKTTLLKRIALHYCCEEDSYSKRKELENRYGLKGEFVPVLLVLRQLRGRVESIQELLINKFSGIPGVDSNGAADLLEEIKDNLLLLIDGLDELSASQREMFLEQLRYFLEQHPDTNVILSSRLAGLLEKNVIPSLVDMGFVARTILPLTDEDAADYSKQWLDETQNDEQKKLVMQRRLKAILTQSRYTFLKEFTRTPLELLVVLRQLSLGALSLNRYQLFMDVLFDLFSGHEKNDRKNAVYKDSMAILGLLAYHLQENNFLYLSARELSFLLPELNNLNYYSDIIRDGTLEEYERFLDNMATNVGIVESFYQGDEINYTFPIRSYLECLAAYACCHLALDAGEDRPTPYKILKQHVEEDEWLNLINFALADIQDSNKEDYNKLIQLIFESETNLHRLSSIIESDIRVDIRQATLLCRRWFEKPILEDRKKELILAWNGNGTANFYNFSLSQLYNRSDDNSYLEAYALSNLLMQREFGNITLDKLLSGMLLSDNKKDAVLGAMTLADSVSLYFDEIVEGYRRRMDEELELSDELLLRLAENALRYGDIISIRALTDLWVAQKGNNELLEDLLDERLRDFVLEEILRSEATAERLLDSDGMTAENEDYVKLLFLFTTLGSFPLKDTDEEIIVPDILLDCFDNMFDKSKLVFGMDRAALAVCGWYLGLGRRQYLDVWAAETGQISKDKLYKIVKKDSESLRERSHAPMVLSALRDLASDDGASSSGGQATAEEAAASSRAAGNSSMQEEAEAAGDYRKDIFSDSDEWSVGNRLL